VFRVGTLNGRQVVVGRSAAGKVNAAIVTTLLIGQFNPSAILFSGTAGAIDPALRQGDVVIGATVAHHDAGQQTADGLRRRGMRNAVTGELDPILLPAPESLLSLARRSAEALRLPSVKTPDGVDRPPRIVEGVIVTGDVFLADNARRLSLRESLGATAVEMEGAAVVQTCRQFAVPCLIIRSITDRADGEALTNYEQFMVLASENAAELAALVIAGLEP
jgi:adenosylhomocysteine nucleosidase